MWKRASSRKPGVKLSKEPVGRNLICFSNIENVDYGSRVRKR